MTLELSDRRRAQLQQILDEIPRTQRRTSIQKWHQVLGELRSMAIAIPGSRGLFCQLQLALNHSNNGRLHLTRRAIHDALADFCWLADNFNCAAHTEIRTDRKIASYPQWGMRRCRIWHGRRRFSTYVRQDSQPTLWRSPFCPSTQAKLVSFTNPTGTITNSDLELAATVVQHEAYAHTADIRECTTHTKSDNTPAALAVQRIGLHQGASSLPSPPASIASAVPSVSQHVHVPPWLAQPHG